METVALAGADDRADHASCCARPRACDDETGA
jgi:hypothetical protein